MSYGKIGSLLESLKFSIEMLEGEMQKECWRDGWLYDEIARDINDAIQRAKDARENLSAYNLFGINEP